MYIESNVEMLVDEYKSIFADLNIDGNEIKLNHILRVECDWTEKGADTVLNLAKTYGSFVLRNALAVAIALDIQDGSIGI
jgi:hypothetical protein